MKNPFAKCQTEHGRTRVQLVQMTTAYRTIQLCTHERNHFQISRATGSHPPAKSYAFIGRVSLKTQRQITIQSGGKRSLGSHAGASAPNHSAGATTRPGEHCAHTRGVPRRVLRSVNMALNQYQDTKLIFVYNHHHSRCPRGRDRNISHTHKHAHKHRRNRAHTQSHKHTHTFIHTFIHTYTHIHS